MKKNYQILYKFLFCLGFLIAFVPIIYGQNYTTKKTVQGKAKKVYYRANQYKKIAWWIRRFKIIKRL